MYFQVCWLMIFFYLCLLYTVEVASVENVVVEVSALGVMTVVPLALVLVLDMRPEVIFTGILVASRRSLIIEVEDMHAVI